MFNPFLTHAWASSPERLVIAATVTLAFAVLACVLRGVNRSGALAGGLACFLLFAGIGPVAFGTLAALFVMTWVSTRLDTGVSWRWELPNAGKVGTHGKFWPIWQ